MGWKSCLQVWFVRGGNWPLLHPIRTLSLMLLLGALALNYTLDHLSINTDTSELIDPDAPFQQFSRRYEQAFSQDLHTMLLVVESETPELTASATRRLLRLINADHEHFRSAYIPGNEPFFRRNGLLYLETAELQSLSDSLSQAQPFIGRIARQPNLSGFLSILSDALTVKEAEAFDLNKLTDTVAGALHKSLNDGNALLSWQDLLQEGSERSATGFILVSPVFDYSQIRPARAAIETVRKAAASIQDPNLPAVKVRISGEVGLEDDELAGVSTGTFSASVFSVVLVLGILLIAYRSVLLTLATLATLALGMVFCGAFAAFAVGKLNLISLAFAVSNIGLGVEYAIHLCLRYHDNLARHIGKDIALRGTLQSTAPALLLSAGTTSIGLFAFIPTDYKGVSELGLLAGTSLFICLLTTFVALPALLKIVPAPLNRQAKGIDHPLSRWPDKIGRLPQHFAKPITIATLALTGLSAILAFELQTDFNPINLRDPNTESVIAFKELMQNKDSTPLTLTVLADDAAAAKTLQRELAKLPTVDKTVSLFDLVPADQEAKLALIDEMALMLGIQAPQFPALQSDPDPVPGIANLLHAINAALASNPATERQRALLALKKEFEDVLLELELRQAPARQLFIDKIQTTLLGTLPNVMNDLFAGLQAQAVTLEDLPAEIRSKWLSKQGWYRIQIYPKQDLNDLDNLRDFIGEVQSVAPETTDLPIMYWESMREVIAAFQQAITIALATIALLLYLIRRNLFDTLLLLTPLVLAGLFTIASAVVTGTPINFANIIALPLLLGLGVDNGIHMFEKLRQSPSTERNIYQSSTARAIFYGALTTTSSFAGLAFSPHQGIASMGLIITMGIFWIMVCTFIILPAFSQWIYGRSRRKHGTF